MDVGVMQVQIYKSESFSHQNNIVVVEQMIVSEVCSWMKSHDLGYFHGMTFYWIVLID